MIWRYGIMVAVNLGILALAIRGWVIHDNVYINLELTLGDVVLWVVFAIVVRGNRKMMKHD